MVTCTDGTTTRTVPVVLYPICHEIGDRAAHILIVEQIWTEANPDRAGAFLWDPADPWLGPWAREAEAQQHATFTTTPEA